MGAFLNRTFLFRRVMPKPKAPQLVLSLQQVIALRYRTQDGVSLQQALLGSHELVVARGQEPVVSNRLWRGLPVNRDDRGARMDRGRRAHPAPPEQ